MRQISIGLVITILAGLSFGNITIEDLTLKSTSEVFAQSIAEEEATTQEMMAGAMPLAENPTEEVTSTTEPTSEGPTTEESTSEEPTSEEPTTEEPTTEEPTSEEPTTEEPTTKSEYEIIDGVYKLKEGVLVEYLGNKKDKKVEKLTIPKEVKKIDKNVFLDCKYIKKVTFEEGSNLTEIGESAFRNCTSLTNITLPEGLKTIGYRAFGKSTALTSLKLPTTITAGDRILGTQSAVKTVTFKKGTKTIPKNILRNAYSVESVKMYSGVTTIGKRAFYECKKLASITLPEGLSSIGYKAFEKCTALTALKIPTTVKSGNSILGSESAVKTVTFKKGTKDIPPYILKNAYSVESVKVYSGITSIGKQAFYGCKNIASMLLPGSITKIYSEAFSGCESMKTLNLPSKVTSISSNTFKDCKVLQDLTIRKTVTGISSTAFTGANNLTLLVYANSYGKAYARKNKIKWEYTSSEIKRREASQEVYNKYMNLVKAKDASKFKLKYLDNYVPQGLCVVGKYVIVSMYYKGLQKNSILLLYNKNTGKFVKRVVLPSKDHVGSITNVKGRLVVGLCNISTTDYVAVISYSKLKKIKNGKTIKYNYTKKIPGYADFAAFDGTIFWAGHSANISYARMYGYKVTVKKKKLVFTKKYSYVVPANSQGLIVKKEKGSNRTFIFSQSYGRLGDSSLITYKTNIKKATSLGTATSTKLMPSMSEGICLTSKGYVYMVFESAAGIYCADPDLTTEIRVNNVCRMKYSKLNKLQDK